MQIIERKLGDNKDLDFTLDLTNYLGKTGADITDIFFVVKEQSENLDVTLFLKKQSLGEITFTGQEVVNVLVKWPSDEYTGFSAGKKYLAGLYPKFSGDTVGDENTDVEFELIIIDDLLKQN